MPANLSSDPSSWQTINYGANTANLFNPTENAGVNYYYDPTSGNLFGSQDATSPLLTKEALDFSKSLSNVSVPNMVNMGDSGMQQSGMKNQYFLGEDPTQIAKDYSLYQSNPHAFNAQTAQNLSNSLFSTWAQNGNNLGSPFGFDLTSQQQDKLNAFKQTDPQAYYNAVLSQKAKEIGWDAGQNKTNQDNNAQFQNLAREAMAAGLSSDDINNIFNSNYQNTAKMNAENISSKAGQGATLQGIEKVLPAIAAMATAGFLAPAAGAIEAGSAGATAVGEGTASTLPSLSWEAPQIGALPASTGTFGSFTAPALGAEATGIGMTGAIPAGVMVGDGTLGTVIGATYQAAAPGQFALDALGNPIQASSVGIDGFAPSSGMSAKDILTNANRLKNLAKAVISKTGGTTTASNPNAKALANILSPSSTGATNFSQINMNQHPFLQAQQPTSIQNAVVKPTDFLAQLNQQEKQPTMADLLRTRIA